MIDQRVDHYVRELIVNINLQASSPAVTRQGTLDSSNTKKVVALWDYEETGKVCHRGERDTGMKKVTNILWNQYKCSVNFSPCSTEKDSLNIVLNSTE